MESLTGESVIAPNPRMDQMTLNAEVGKQLLSYYAPTLAKALRDCPTPKDLIEHMTYLTSGLRAISQEKYAEWAEEGVVGVNGGAMDYEEYANE